MEGHNRRQVPPAIIHLYDVLKVLRRRPNIYGSPDPLVILHYMHGIRVACGAFGFAIDPLLYANIVSAHGWEHPVYQWLGHKEGWERLREIGLDDTQIGKEILEIELEVWKQAYSNIE